MRIIIIILSLSLIAASAPAEFKLESPAFADNGLIPTNYTCRGNNYAPPLKWSNPPAGTKSFVLIFTWPESALGSLFYGWIVYNIAGDMTSLPGDNKNLPAGIMVGNNSYNIPAYDGPCPTDKIAHHYTFILYALDTVLYLPEGASATDVYDRIKDHVLNQTILRGYFKGE